ncbi:MAG: DUF1501 domain-containing protein, partial [Verrucomicrobia bacterium]|nr:DUF1501 domain-containing protein [Verrucomicrobiota bacterium]
QAVPPSVVGIEGAVGTTAEDKVENVQLEMLPLRDGKLTAKVGGGIPMGGLPLTIWRRAADPSWLAGHALADVCRQFGIEVHGKVRRGHPVPLDLLAFHRSEPLGKLLHALGKHSDNFNALKSRNLPTLDAGLAGLFAALAAKGLLETTCVFVTGEFGRTPKVNARGGRDHYPRAMFCLLGGGGVQGGQVVGESDAKGEGPKDKAITPDDVAATFYRALGIDSRKEYQTRTGRPIMIVRNGTPLKELVA